MQTHSRRSFRLARFFLFSLLSPTAIWENIYFQFSDSGQVKEFYQNRKKNCPINWKIKLAATELVIVVVSNWIQPEKNDRIKWYAFAVTTREPQIGHWGKINIERLRNLYCQPHHSVELKFFVVVSFDGTDDFLQIRRPASLPARPHNKLMKHF